VLQVVLDAAVPGRDEVMAALQQFCELLIINEHVVASAKRRGGHLRREAWKGTLLAQARELIGQVRYTERREHAVMLTGFDRPAQARSPSIGQATGAPEADQGAHGRDPEEGPSPHDERHVTIEIGVSVGPVANSGQRSKEGACEVVGRDLVRISRLPEYVPGAVYALAVPQVVVAELVRQGEALPDRTKDAVDEDVWITAPTDVHASHVLRQHGDRHRDRSKILHRYENVRERRLKA
jgi:hypothetical protein